MRTGWRETRAAAGHSRLAATRARKAVSRATKNHGAEVPRGSNVREGRSLAAVIRGETHVGAFICKDHHRLCTSFRDVGTIALRQLRRYRATCSNPARVCASAAKIAAGLIGGETWVRTPRFLLELPDDSLLYPPICMLTSKESSIDNFLVHQGFYFGVREAKQATHTRICQN